MNLPQHSASQSKSYSDWYVSSMERLVGVVQELSHARTIEDITAIVRDAARSLTGADGATFVLKDGDQCYYAEENAIGPLWKGRRFPLTRCISGWAMLNAKAAVIEDIYQDARIPADAYRPTFVKSLVMVPVRKSAPIAAIGNYWATNHEATGEEVAILQALADTTSVALENVELYNQLHKKIGELEQSNYDLNCFAWAASHDLQEPLRTIMTQIELLERDLHGTLDERDSRYIKFALEGTGRLQHLVQNLLAHAHVEQRGSFQPVALSQVAKDVIQGLGNAIQESGATVQIGALPWVEGDAHLLECLLQNLISNAIKFHARGVAPRVSIAAQPADNEWIFSVADNGIGIEEEHQKDIFGLFKRLNTQSAYAGSGIGLAICRKILDVHNGRIWAESTPGEGSIFWFALPRTEMNA